MTKHLTSLITRTLAHHFIHMLFLSDVNAFFFFFQDGLFSRRDIENMWRPPDHPEGVAAVYLELMQTFEVFLKFQFTCIDLECWFFFDLCRQSNPFFTHTAYISIMQRPLVK